MDFKVAYIVFLRRAIKWIGSLLWSRGRTYCTYSKIKESVFYSFSYVCLTVPKITLTLISLSGSKFEIKVGSLHFNPISKRPKRSFKMSYFHGVSYVFSRSKMIDTAWSYFFSAFRINFSKRTRWSNVLLPWRNLYCILDKSPLHSWNHARRALIIMSMVLHTQHVSAICR